VSRSMGENYPITSVNWIECIKFCNLLSKIAGLKEYYNIKYDLLDDYTSCIVKYHFDDAEILSNSKGFRLPTEAEFEYAARGGNKSKNYLYSGSNEIDKVAWYKNNSNGELQLVGQKQPNELGLHDMSGNVIQWCYDGLRIITVIQGLIQLDAANLILGMDWLSEFTGEEITYQNLLIVKFHVEVLQVQMVYI
jgi:sulfatase modifying factor 1